MEKPVNLNVLIKELGISAAAAKKMIEQYEINYWHFHYEMCQVCGKELTEKELRENQTPPESFYLCSYTCSEHRKYGEWFDLVKARRELGLPLFIKYPFNEIII